MQLGSLILKLLQFKYAAQHLKLCCMNQLILLLLIVIFYFPPLFSVVIYLRRAPPFVNYNNVKKVFCAGLLICLLSISFFSFSISNYKLRYYDCWIYIFNFGLSFKVLTSIKATVRQMWCSSFHACPSWFAVKTKHHPWTGLLVQYEPLDHLVHIFVKGPMSKLEKYQRILVWSSTKV